MSLPDTAERTLKDRMPAGLLDSIVAKLNPVRVIVFGSQATGNTHPDSDWDVLIVVDDDTPTEKINWKAIHLVREGIRGAMDLIPCRVETFENRADIVGALPWIAKTKGIVVYDRAKAA